MLDILSRNLQELCGISVNHGKLHSWSRSGGAAPPDLAALDTPDHTVWRSDMAPADNGVTVVGTPIGCDEYVRGAVQSKVVEQQSFTRAIMALPSSQVSWLLFLYCAVPRVNHLLRTIPPGQASAIAAQHDQLIAHAFSELLGLSPGSDTDAAHGVSRDVWERQARLPLTLGGCGLRSSARTSPAAFWASLADCLPVLSRRYPQFAAQLVASLDQQTAQPGDPRTLIGGANEAARFLRDQGFEAMPSWDLLCGGVLPPDEDGDEAGPDEDRRGWQGRASRVLEKAEHESLLVALAGTTRQGPLPGRARLRSCSGPHAGAWLATIPSTDALRLSNPEFLCALRRRLGLATGGAREHCEGCGRAIDPHGHHRTACGRTGRHCARHKCVVAAWRQVFQEAGGHVPKRNVERMLRDTHVPVDPRDARRLDLLVTGLSVARGLPLFVDATCLSPITGTGFARSGCTTQNGALLDRAVRDNLLTYHEVEESGLGKLYSLGAEVFGRWCTDAVALVPQLLHERCRGLPQSVRVSLHAGLSRRWWGLLGVAVQRQVARAILRGPGYDLVEHALEPPPHLSDLPAG